MLTLIGFNHITLAVANLDRAFDFYVSVLGLKPHARWEQGAYLSLDSLWLCLSLDAVQPGGDYTHYAFSVNEKDFSDWRNKLTQADVCFWKDNTSEGDSIYFLDPDGHKLELHCGDLASRLASIAQEPYENLQLFN